MLLLTWLHTLLPAKHTHTRHGDGCATGEARVEDVGSRRSADFSNRF